jgi:hypothetical protein
MYTVQLQYGIVLCSVVKVVITMCNQVFGEISQITRARQQNAPHPQARYHTQVVHRLARSHVQTQGARTQAPAQTEHLVPPRVGWGSPGSHRLVTCRLCAHAVCAPPRMDRCAVLALRPDRASQSSVATRCTPPARSTVHEAVGQQGFRERRVNRR